MLLHDLLHHLPAASIFLWPPFPVLVVVLAACQLMQTLDMVHSTQGFNTSDGKGSSHGQLEVYHDVLQGMRSEDIHQGRQKGS